MRPLATGGAGVARALEAARAAARSPLLARMDADDVCSPDRLARQVEALAADERLAVVGTRVEAFPEPGEGLRRYVAWQNSLVTPEEHAASLFVESPLCHPSVLYPNDPEFKMMELVCDLVKQAGDRAAMMDLDAIAKRAATAR